ncbi:hypothetical protein HS088_TW12G00247 [Tripterygium wilfordii]|uniref:Kri1-like C-terminal domain-containing protein n=1 Tax=Tripterygium wilfordii TaxID=458696 RepID=A0A7J7CYL5_TRIWF|nr:protein kri1 [Tripterygium wilfordii]KAF5739049.1 hypothetical protein HS088_TW12G00247 [Tripterygium wilfordii]
MGMNLFDDGGDDKQNDDISKIEINKEYARRFEYNKKREDLQRYQELKKKGVIESSDMEDSSSEDGEDDFDLKDSSNKDLEFFDALIKVRNQDPLLKQKDVKLFDSDDDDSEKEEVELGEKRGKGKKAMYLKDVTAKHLIEEGPEFEESEVRVKGGKKSYNEEQEEIRKAFLDAAKEVEDDDGGDLLNLKEKKREDVVEDGDGDEFAKKVDEYFVGEGELDENSLFLRDFFRKRMWEDKDGNKMDVDEDMDEVLRDEEEMERQEEYEQGYNFRYEENAGDRVMSYSRRVEGSVRKKENARKEQRKSKEERMRIAEMERKEELKHLKNLKKKEMEERMRKVLGAAGIREDDECMLDLDDLEEDFDPEEYDKKMKKAFDEKYYEDEDVDPQFGSDKDEDGAEIEKPDFDEEDELLGLPKGWDAPESHDGFLATRERILKRKAENCGEEDDSEEEAEEGEEDEKEGEEEESRPKRKRKMSLVKKVKQEMLEEYYKLDYEDTVGDLKTRFKYAKVHPNRYGLKTEEILMLDDSELNQYVSLKKITPFQEEEWKVPNSKKYEQKMKIKELVTGKKLDGGKAGKKKDNKKADKKQRSKNEGDVANSVVISTKDEKDQAQESNGDVSKLSRKARRKRNQAELKLSHSRLIAYGKIQPKSKNKRKH